MRQLLSLFLIHCVSFSAHVVLYAFLGILVECDKSSRVGHLQPLSRQGPKDTEQPDVLRYIPSPQEFFEKYVKKIKPVLFKDVLDGEYLAYSKWTDKYLADNYGDLIVEVERGKKENRVDGMRYMRLRNFIEVYQSNDLYMVHNVPEEMEHEVLVVSCLACGGFDEVLTEAVIWFSSGGTKSVLHNDQVDNINCLLDGYKNVLLFDTAHSDAIKSHGFAEETGHSTVDVDEVDLDVFPQFAGLPWQHVRMEKGDCLYIPYQMFHQVNTANVRSIAVNVWFSHIWWFNQSDCTDTSPDHVSLSNVHFASSNEHVRTIFLAPFAHLPNISLDQFNVGLSPVETQTIFTQLDENGDNSLSWPELYSVDIDWLVGQHPGLSSDSRPTDRHGEL